MRESESPHAANFKAFRVRLSFLTLRATSHKTARHKLNGAYFLGALLIAGLVGAMFESWTVFMIAAGVLIMSSVHDGDIRP
jgi:hypothetical protein